MITKSRRRQISWADHCQREFIDFRRLAKVHSIKDRKNSTDFSTASGMTFAGSRSKLRSTNQSPKNCCLPVPARFLGICRLPVISACLPLHSFMPLRPAGTRRNSQQQNRLVCGAGAVRVRCFGVKNFSQSHQRMPIHIDSSRKAHLLWRKCGSP